MRLKATICLSPTSGAAHENENTIQSYWGLRWICNSSDLQWIGWMKMCTWVECERLKCGINVALWIIAFFWSKIESGRLTTNVLWSISWPKWNQLDDVAAAMTTYDNVCSASDCFNFLFVANVSPSLNQWINRKRLIWFSPSLSFFSSLARHQQINLSVEHMHIESRWLTHYANARMGELRRVELTHMCVGSTDRCWNNWMELMAIKMKQNHLPRRVCMTTNHWKSLIISVQRAVVQCTSTWNAQITTRLAKNKCAHILQMKGYRIYLFVVMLLWRVAELVLLLL